jgi:DNA helicase-2/ATP-dependent DNA helicase PcrA
MSTQSPWHRGLNPEQIQAVDHNYGALLILAGAGSGKTTVLVARTGRLIYDRVVSADQALVLTFTNKAARELKHRVHARLGDLSKGLWAGTFHSFGLQILRKHSAKVGLPAQFAVLDQNDGQALVRELMKEIKITGKDKFDLATILELINTRRVKGRFSQEAFDEYHEMAEVLFPKYIKKLEVLGAVDFEGLLLKPVELFQEQPDVLARYQEQFQQVMVDEFQDTNSTQMKLIDFLIRSHRNITVVGDDDQSIYGWRGAEVQNILQFPKQYAPCEVIRLERNYRSTPQILDLANLVISHNKTRHGKVLKSEGASERMEVPELFVIDNEDEESDLVLAEIHRHVDQGGRLAEVAVLYRSNSQGGLIESVLRQNRIDYSVSGSTAFFDRKEIKDILAYLRCAIFPNDVSLRRIINVPTRGIGDSSVEKLNHFATAQACSFLVACKQWKVVGLPERVGGSLDQCLDLFALMPERIMQGDQCGANLLLLLREMGYRDYLYQSSPSSEAGERKWQIVEIFARVLDSFVAKGGASLKTLGEFIDAMELRDTEEDDEERSANKVQLMTLHAAKGLEFPLVLLLGVEEDLLPHKSLGSNVDEERRLFYVGLTRAKSQLVLTRCRTRKRYGEQRSVSPSRFLLEILKAQESRKSSLIRSYENGARPVTVDQRQKLVGDFLSQLQNKKRDSL